MLLYAVIGFLAITAIYTVSYAICEFRASNPLGGTLVILLAALEVLGGLTSLFIR